MTARWGYADTRGAIMPGPGLRKGRDYADDEADAVAEVPGAAALLGERTGDVYLNAVAYWRNVPDRVWE